MPFVKEKFNIPKKIPAFLFIMRTFNFTQGQAQRVLAKGRLLIAGESIFNTGESVEGDVEVVYFKPSSKGHTPLFQNKNFMIYEKHSGVLVHPNTMATPYSLLDEIRTIAGDNANAVHRIDMETSGLLLASKHKKAESYLKCSFEDRSIKKSYLAWVDGKLTEPFSSHEPIKINNDYSQSKHKVFISVDGKASHTDFTPLAYDETLDATLVACYPHTGRTHQIRVHLFHVKHPIVGDPIYGQKESDIVKFLDKIITSEERVKLSGSSKLLLHASQLEFKYNGNKYCIKSDNQFREETINHIKRKLFT